MTTLLAIDPGPEESAALWLFEDGHLEAKNILPNPDLESWIQHLAITGHPSMCWIEMVESYGMAVGKSVFETVYWTGRFASAWDRHAATKCRRLGRKAVKLHLCGHSKAKDSNIRQALIDRYGGVAGKQTAVGTKAARGPLYGVRKDLWAALALGVTALDIQNTQGTAA